MVFKQISRFKVKIHTFKVWINVAQLTAAEKLLAGVQLTNVAQLTAAGKLLAAVQLIVAGQLLAAVHLAGAVLELVDVA